MGCGLIKVAAKALLNLRVTVMTRSITPKHVTNLVGPISAVLRLNNTASK